MDSREMVAGGDRVTGGGGIVGELPSVVGHYAELTVCTSGSSQGDTYHSNWDSTKEDRTTGHFSGTSTSSQGASGTFVGEVTSTRFTLSFSRVPPRYTCKDTAHIEAGWRDIRHVHGLRRQCWQLHRDTRFELGAAAFDLHYGSNSTRHESRALGATAASSARSTFLRVGYQAGLPV